MTVSLHNLKAGARSSKKRVGRGGKRGTYSGRGQKGQRARSGARGGLKRLGLRALMQQTHKLRGFKSQYKKPAIVNLGDLSNNFNDGDIVTPAKLIQRGLIKSRRYGVKILGNGELTKKITIKDCQMSKSVAAKIVKN